MNLCWTALNLLLINFLVAKVQPFVVSPGNYIAQHKSKFLPRPSPHFMMTDPASMMVASALSDGWNAYNTALEAEPLLVKSLTASVILGSADVVGQVIQNGKKEDEENEFDVLRSLRFAFFGLVLQAPWNHFYYLLLDGALPPTPDNPLSQTTIVKVIIDQFVQAPVFTVLIFFFLGLLEGKNIEAVQMQLKDDYKDTMLANWKLFIPATVVNLAFCPPLFRVLFLNVVFFFWSIYLSLVINKEEA